MVENSVYISNKMSLTLEGMIKNIDTFDEFEKRFSDEFLADDDRVGNYLRELIWKYDRDFSSVSDKAGLDRSYVGNIVRGKKNNPGRDALIAICLEIGTTVDEVQYLLKYAGQQ